MVISGHPVPVVRFELANRTLSYPTAALRQWELLILGQEEKLRIKAGGDWIVITGCGLAAVRDALDLFQLQRLRQAPTRRAAITDNAWVSAIQIETQNSGTAMDECL